MKDLKDFDIKQALIDLNQAAIDHLFSKEDNAVERLREIKIKQEQIIQALEHKDKRIDELYVIRKNKIGCSTDNEIIAYSTDPKALEIYLTEKLYLVKETNIPNGENSPLWMEPTCTHWHRIDRLSALSVEPLPKAPEK